MLTETVGVSGAVINVYRPQWDDQEATTVMASARGYPWRRRASSCFATLRGGAADAEALVQQADASLYEAKRARTAAR